MSSTQLAKQAFTCIPADTDALSKLQVEEIVEGIDPPVTSDALLQTRDAGLRLAGAGASSWAPSAAGG
jgi:hypothetical protein